MHEAVCQFNFASHPARRPAALHCDEGPRVTIPRRAVQRVPNTIVTRAVAHVLLHVAIADPHASSHAVDTL
eukprot:3636430-Pyramimonas_sp.AAC.1